MLLLLPPSEGKSAPRRGRSLDLASLSSPALHQARVRVLEALVRVSTSSDAAAVLGLSPGLAAEAARNAVLPIAPTARADQVYSGVLYDALSFATLSPAARRRASGRVAITSALFGLLRPTDRIPAYRLSGGVSLPTVGPVAALWRGVLGPVVTDAVGNGLLVDLRSTAYAAFWRPPAALAARTATVRVLHEAQGRRTVVSHFNKATKGRLVRDVLEHSDTPRSPSDLVTLLAELGWRVEPHPPTARGTQVDVVVGEV